MMSDDSARLSPIFVGAGASTVSDRRRRATDALEQWLESKALETLLVKFGADAAALARDRLRLAPAGLADRVFDPDSWLGRDTPDRTLLECFRAARPLSEPEQVLAALLMLDEFGVDAWNFRTGPPLALRRSLMSLPAMQSISAPPLKSPLLSASAQAEERNTLDFYLGPDASLVLQNGTDLNAVRDELQSSLKESADSVLNILRSIATPIDPTYQERWQGSKLAIPDEEARGVYELARSLDLIDESRPSAQTYDHLVVLGGGGMSPLLRARYAKELIEDGTGVGDVWLLGSPRRIQDDERHLSDLYAPGALDEFDVMSAAAHHAFSLETEEMRFLCGCSDVDVSCPTWRRRLEPRVPATVLDATPAWLQHERIRTLTFADGRVVRVLSASTSNPPDRPNTADTYRLLSDVASLAPAQRALIVTTQVFVPFQTFDAIRMLLLPTGVGIDVVGFDASRGDRSDAPEFLLQEVLSAIRSARRLAVDLV